MHYRCNFSNKPLYLEYRLHFCESSVRRLKPCNLTAPTATVPYRRVKLFVLAAKTPQFLRPLLAVHPARTALRSLRVPLPRVPPVAIAGQEALHLRASPHQRGDSILHPMYQTMQKLPPKALPPKKGSGRRGAARRLFGA